MMVRSRVRQAVALILFSFAGTVGTAPTLDGQEAEEAAVLAVVEQLFDAMRGKNGAAIRGLFTPGASLMAVSATGVSPSSIDAFARSVEGSSAFLDEVTFDEKVRIDGPLATAWTPYNLFIDNAFRHCGVDAFQMVKTGQGWKIFQLADTRRTEGCDPERRN